MRQAAATTLLLALAALPAAAQDRPPLTPSRDVAVTYRFEGGPPGPGGAQGAEMRLSWLASEGRMRTDLPGGIGWSLTDTRSGEVTMVQDAQRMIMQMPRDPSRPNPLAPPPDMKFTRGGTDTVLGYRCTVWTVQGNEGSGEACVTEDGVMLRSRGMAGGQSGGMVATQVAYGAQDPTRFRVPQGYQVMQMPGGPGAPGGRPPGSR